MSNSTNNLAQELYKIRTELDKRLDDLLPLPSNLTKRVVESMRYSVLGGGKALRPFLVLTVGGLLKIDETDLWPIACALEMVHTYSLIHDDLPAMDNDTLRRGKPSNHIQFDEATAILAGNALLTKAFEILSASNWPVNTDIKCQLINMLAHAAGSNGMIGGQMIDLIGEKQKLNESNLRQMQTLKTGALLEFACLAPCVLKPNEEIETALKTYASNIGLLFQITDDLLDETGDEISVGKTLGKDKNAHKTTFVSFYGIDKARQIAQDLTYNAIQSISIFGEKGAILAEIAQLILTREK